MARRNQKQNRTSSGRNNDNSEARPGEVEQASPAADMTAPDPSYGLSTGNRGNSDALFQGAVTDEVVDDPDAAGAMNSDPNSDVMPGGDGGETEIADVPASEIVELDDGLSDDGAGGSIADAGALDTDTASPSGATTEDRLLPVLAPTEPVGVRHSPPPAVVTVESVGAPAGTAGASVASSAAAGWLRANVLPLAFTTLGIGLFARSAAAARRQRPSSDAGENGSSGVAATAGNTVRVVRDAAHSAKHTLKEVKGRVESVAERIEERAESLEDRVEDALDEAKDRLEERAEALAESAASRAKSVGTGAVGAVKTNPLAVAVTLLGIALFFIPKRTASNDVV
jgi:gas vesicle protein